MATDITGIPEVQNALLRFQSKVNASAERALRRCGLLAVREAKANAPRSPTKSQFSATLVRKKRTSRRRFTPGGLEKSIEYEVQGMACAVWVVVVDVGVVLAVERWRSGDSFSTGFAGLSGLATTSHPRFFINYGTSHE